MEFATARAAVLEIELQEQHLTLSVNIGLSLTMLDSPVTVLGLTQLALMCCIPLELSSTKHC